MSNILALDISIKNIGVAINNKLNFVYPLVVIKRHNRDNDIKKIEDLIKLYKIDIIVIGLPWQQYDKLGLIGKKIISFSKRLKYRNKVNIYYIDEFETTVEAKKNLKLFNISKKKYHKKIDKLAAMFILKRYLNEK